MKMKKWTWVAVLLLFVFSLSCAGLGKPETSKFILMASTFGWIEAGIVAVLENFSGSEKFGQT